MKSICGSCIALLSATIMILLFLGINAPLYAQTPVCEPVITLIGDAIANCDELNTNWACYGHTTNLVAPAAIRFVRPKDRQPIEVIEAISTKFRNGVAFLRLQTQAESAPVTAILFGALNLEPDRQEERNNIFLLYYEEEGTLCEKTPSGMVVRTESGQRGRITLNNVDIELGSTAFITVRDLNEMEVVNLEGNVTVTVDALGVSRQLPIGQSVQITLANNLPLTVTLPAPADTFASPVLQWLATDDDGLPRITDSNTITNPVVPRCGGTITYEQPIIDEHHVPGQECLFTFPGNSGDRVTVNIDALDGGLDPWIDLRAPNKQLIKANNDIDEVDSNSLICNNRLLTDGLYTIVARPANNESIGRFQITLSRASDCQEPVDQCEVVAESVALRTNASVNATIVRTLGLGTRFYARDRTENRQWLQVRLVGSEEAGWIALASSAIVCDGAPTEATAGASARPPICPALPAGWIRHTVRSGDTLSQLAVATGTTVARIREVNCLTSTLIWVGQLLYLPNVPSPPCRELVITGFTIVPGATGATVSWGAAGGCAPLGGTLTVRYSNGSAASFAVGVAGSLNVAYPADESCPLSGVYSLSMRDRSGLGASVVRSAPLRNDCPKKAPVPDS